MRLLRDARYSERAEGRGKDNRPKGRWPGGVGGPPSPVQPAFSRPGLSCGRTLTVLGSSAPRCGPPIACPMSSAIGTDTTNHTSRNTRILTRRNSAAWWLSRMRKVPRPEPAPVNSRARRDVRCRVVTCRWTETPIAMMAGARSRSLRISAAAECGRMTRMQTYEKLYIDGAWVQPAGPGTIDVVNAVHRAGHGPHPRGNARRRRPGGRRGRALPFPTWSPDREGGTWQVPAAAVRGPRGAHDRHRHHDRGRGGHAHAALADHPGRAADRGH